MTVSTRAHKAAKRYIYAWGGGRAEGNGSMKELLGGKGAGLAEMTLAGLPTPPGFTITTAVCAHFYANGHGFPATLAEQVDAALKETGRTDEALSLPDDATVRDLLAHYEARSPKVRAYLGSLAVSVNQEFASGSQPQA